MLRRKFLIEKHEDYGELGLRPLWMPGDPLNGMAIPHDMLEHPQDGGRLEFQATGGVVWLRGETSYFGMTRGNQDPVENIASDFIMLAGLWDGEELPVPPRTQSSRERDEEMIAAVIERGCRYIRSESDGREEMLQSEFLTPVGREKIRGWMRNGYDKCRRRWRRWSNHHMCYVFRELEKRALAFEKDDMYIEGLEVLVTVDIDECRTSFIVEDAWAHEYE